MWRRAVQQRVPQASTAARWRYARTVEPTFIVSEVQRLAAENGGVPLGRRRFEDETGIREKDWLGKHWTRWSDLVAAAGHEVQPWNGRHDDAHLLLMFEQLVRDHGRWPTRAEVKMRRLEDATFPSANTFDRFGDRAGLASALLAFTTDPIVSDVCRPLAAVDTEQKVESGDAYDGSRGFVYLMRSGKFHKIGRTNSVGRRHYEMAIQLPERVEVVHSLETDDPEGIERYWHERFAAKRVNGEWFKLSSGDVAAFKRRKRFM